MSQVRETSKLIYAHSKNAMALLKMSDWFYLVIQNNYFH